jgi:hypothetical protein
MASAVDRYLIAVGHLTHARRRDRPGVQLPRTNPAFLSLVALYEVFFVVVPAIDAARQRRWFWCVAILTLQPVAGVLWCLLRRSGSRRRRTA